MGRISIEDLLAKQEITEQIHAYCRSMDCCDHELSYQVWHPDGTADYGLALYHGTGQGFADMVLEAHENMVNHCHFVSDVMIEVDGDKAASETMYIARLGLSGTATLSIL